MINREEILQRARDAVKGKIALDTGREDELVPEEEVLDDIGDEPTDADVGVDEEVIDQPDLDAEDDSLGDEPPEGEDSNEEGEEGDEGEDADSKDAEQPGLLLKDYTRKTQRLASDQAAVNERSRQLDDIMGTPAKLEAFLKGKGLSVTKKEAQKIIEFSEDDMPSDFEKKIANAINLLGNKMEEQVDLGLSLKQNFGEAEAARQFASVEAEFKELAKTPEINVPETVFPMVAMLLQKGQEQYGATYTTLAAVLDYKKLHPEANAILEKTLDSMSEKELLATLDKNPELYKAIETSVLKRYRKNKKTQNKGTKSPSAKGSATAPVTKKSGNGPKTLEQLKIEAKAKIKRAELAGTL